MAAAKEPHILIIGAGITGLLIAHGLQQAGIKYTIFETEDAGRWRSKEWTMGIHWGLPLLEGLLPPHLAARIVKDGSVDASLDYSKPPNNGAYIFDGVSGELLKDLSVPDRLVRVSRRKLRMLCQEDVEINWAHTIQSVTTNEGDGTVTATFTNGKEYTGTLLVGCDGPRSPTRNFLFDSDPALAQVQPIDGIVNVSMAIQYPDAATARYVRENSHPVWHISIHPDIFNFISMQEVPDPDRPETWRFYIVTSWLGNSKDDSLDNAGRMKFLKDKARNLAEPFRTSILSIPDDTQIPLIDLGCWIAQPWNTRHGLATLAGDSCHPMPPFRGQGGNHAIQDAHNFVEAVKAIVKADGGERGKVQAEMMRQYSDEVAKRGAEETALSTKNGRMMLAYSAFKESPYMKQGLSRG